MAGDNLLGDLRHAAEALIDLAERGEWAALPVAVVSFAEIEARLDASPTAANRDELLATQALLQRAVELCRERQEQIGPLVGALSKTKPAKP